jgi:hypothetical protein
LNHPNSQTFQKNNPFTAKLISDTNKQAVITEFSRANQQFLAALKTWDDPTLDQYAMPHPLLGLLSAREMMYECHYHNQHHAISMQTQYQQYFNK